MEKRVSDQTCIVGFSSLRMVEAQKDGRPKYLIAKYVERNLRPLRSRWYSDIHTSPQSVLYCIMIRYFLIFEGTVRECQ